MDLIEKRRKLSELTEAALESNDIESLKTIKVIVDKERLISVSNFGEFFYSMTQLEMLQEISKR